MRTLVKLPQWGMSMLDGTVIHWLKREGEAVEAGEDIVEIEAAKLTDFVHAPVSGILSRIVVQEGETVEIQAVLGEIESS